jgi:hypothetical protein
MSLLPSSVVDPAYRHLEKSAFPLANANGTVDRLKWYSVREPSQEIPSSVLGEASEKVAQFVSAEDVGFVIVHLCGPDFIFLIVCRWRQNNELWETVFGKAGEAPFEPVHGEDTRATFCVWELGVVGAERVAWATFLSSKREEIDLLRYETDRFSGAV